MALEVLSQDKWSINQVSLLFVASLPLGQKHSSSYQKVVAENRIPLVEDSVVLDMSFNDDVRKQLLERNWRVIFVNEVFFQEVF